jgi:quaternary ammonium compound-resistance protein SugE
VTFHRYATGTLDSRPGRWEARPGWFSGTDAFTVLDGQRRDVNAWLLLFVAGLFEAVWAVGLAYADGFTEPVPSAVTIAAMAVSVYLLAQAVQELPVGTAYAVWTGIGAVATATYGIYRFGESASVLRVGCIILIVVGIAGLQVTGSHAG